MRTQCDAAALARDISGAIAGLAATMQAYGQNPLAEAEQRDRAAVASGASPAKLHAAGYVVAIS